MTKFSTSVRVIFVKKNLSYFHLGILVNEEYLIFYVNRNRKHRHRKQIMGLGRGHGLSLGAMRMVWNQTEVTVPVAQQGEYANAADSFALKCEFSAL